ncbi:DNA-binding domain-containing protein [Tannerella forsythia]|uniref:DNA-binding domain-containing protein n=1 Tax=Tannerella forsythia TaxID=28112 RepID=UPI00242AF9DC|nr:DNA-binding domain-containing protein [Tannerella forsythia]
MSKTRHTIKAYLYDNLLTPDPNDFTARVSSERSLSVADICHSAATRGGADVSDAAMSHAVELFLKEMAYRLCDGFAVNTGYFTAVPVVRGVFLNPNETFDPQRHTLQFHFAQGELMRREIEDVEVKIMGVAETGLYIGQVEDMKSRTVNEVLTPGFNLRVTGTKLRVVGDKPGVGIFFRETVTNTATKVDEADIVVNNPSELMIIIPALPAGTYQLEVTTQYSTGNKLLKEVRSAVFDRPLTVK